MLGISKCEGVDEIQELITNEVGGHIDEMLNERLLSILSTKGKCESSDTWIFTRGCQRISGDRDTNRHCGRKTWNVVHL